MKITSAEFEISAPRLALCPKRELPEFAFIGRSNVGKSSLINCLTGRKGLAKVSDLPGKTKLMNFFLINQRWRLVDLPGYGYAKVGKEQRADFNEATAEYLQERSSLAGVFVLIDSRLEPQELDLSFLHWIDEAEVPCALVFTKADKQSSTRTEASIARFTAALQAEGLELPEYFVTSSVEEVGRKEILAFIHAHLS